jgi:vacuolar-type H+-ATPase catalytic subunit A/Vma1
LFYLLLEVRDGLLVEMVMKYRFSATLIRLLEMSEMGALHGSANSSNNPVATLRTSIYTAFLSIVYMENTSFFVVS